MTSERQIQMLVAANEQQQEQIERQMAQIASRDAIIVTLREKISSLNDRLTKIKEIAAPEVPVFRTYDASHGCGLCGRSNCRGNCFK